MNNAQGFKKLVAMLGPKTRRDDELDEGRDLALGLVEIRPPPVESVCSECDMTIHGEVFPCQTHKWCFAALDGPYDEDEEADADNDEDNEE